MARALSFPYAPSHFFCFPRYGRATQPLLLSQLRPVTRRASEPLDGRSPWERVAVTRLVGGAGVLSSLRRFLAGSRFLICRLWRQSSQYTCCVLDEW